MFADYGNLYYSLEKLCTYVHRQRATNLPLTVNHTDDRSPDFFEDFNQVYNCARGICCFMDEYKRVVEYVVPDNNF